ncbi:MAG TPA: SUMF1/EgtB/PvdO family nonheme iron enzyme, partial [Planctomycetota bacterium]|nr:SUMF1/EgtB/PvdO family nonheme iron enzyme [Planctomycetota bacterium]
EVTVAQLRAVNADELGEVLKESTRGIDNPEGMPAWFFDVPGALAFEKASGKRIPTVPQWLHAAFGPFSESQSKYPWGNDLLDPTRAYADPESKEPIPQRVGGRERGASPYGIEDMAGNVAEWVRNGAGNTLWVIGGHHQMSYASLDSLSGASPIRKPMPGSESYDAMNSTEKETWKNYRFQNLGKDAVSWGSGLRMVVPVKQ